MTPSPHPDGVSVSGDNQAEPKWETLEDAVRRLGRVGAWAPGAYVNKCRPCGIQFIGDKRALSCLPCAISALLATPPPPPMAPTAAGSGHKDELGPLTRASTKSLLIDIAQMLDGWKQTSEPGDWTDWDQSVRHRLSVWLIANEATERMLAVTEPFFRSPPPPAAGQDLSEGQDDVP